DVLPEVQVVVELLPGLERVAHVRGDPLAGDEPVHHELGRAEPDLVRLVRQAELLEDRDRGVKVDRGARRSDNFGLAVEHSHSNSLPRQPERCQQADGPCADDDDLPARDAQATAPASRRRSITRGLVSTTNSAASPAPIASAPWI